MRDWTSKNIAEMVGIVAIVLSLLFVGYQLKQDRDIAISSAYQSRAFEAAEQSRRLGENEAAVRGTIRASLMQDPDDPFPPGMFPSVFDGIPAKEVYASMTLVFAA